ncbi:MAG: hypothetical protein IJ507_00245 [Clostridia bacterium]|nr:hypothetical protein [Clostridia bacterium]
MIFGIGSLLCGEDADSLPGAGIPERIHKGAELYEPVHLTLCAFDAGMSRRLLKKLRECAAVAVLRTKRGGACSSFRECVGNDISSAENGVLSATVALMLRGFLAGLM